MKTVPFVLLLPLVFAARDRRSAVTVVVAAFAVLVIAMEPFRAETPDQLQAITKYAGIPGFGGISLLLEPTFSADALSEHLPAVQAPILVLLATVGPTPVLLPALMALAFIFYRRRPDALTGICLTYLAVYVFGVSFFVSYLVWFLPFLIIRGHLKTVALLQLALAPAQILVFNAPVNRGLALVLYTAVMFGGWFVAAGTLGVWLRRIWRGEAMTRPAPVGVAAAVDSS